jgi:hypothetical protein
MLVGFIHRHEVVGVHDVEEYKAPESAWLFITNGDESTGMLLQKGNIQIHY